MTICTPEQLWALPHTGLSEWTCSVLQCALRCGRREWRELRHIWKITITGPASLTHWPVGDLDSIWKVLSSILFYWLVSSRLLMIMPLDECHGTYLKISQHGSGNGSVPSGNEPLPEPMLTKICHHMASLGHNELNDPCLLRHLTQGDPPEILRQTNISLNHGIPSFNCGTALGTKILRENFYFSWLQTKLSRYNSLIY